MADPVTWATLLKYGGPTVATLLGGLFGGDGGASKEAAASQAALNKELLNIFREQQKMENPFRKRLLQQLAARSNQQFPGTDLPKPGQVLFNPLARQAPAGQTPALPGEGPPSRRARGSFLTRTPQPQAGG